MCSSATLTHLTKKKKGRNLQFFQKNLSGAKNSFLGVYKNLLELEADSESADWLCLLLCLILCLSFRGNLLSYILFLRITPFLPNWFINIVSPVIGKPDTTVLTVYRKICFKITSFLRLSLGVPLLPFWFGSFFGVAPPSFVFIQVNILKFYHNLMARSVLFRKN